MKHAVDQIDMALAQTGHFATTQTISKAATMMASRRSCSRTSNRVHSNDRKPEWGSDCTATLSVSSARLTKSDRHRGP